MSSTPELAVLVRQATNDPYGDAWKYDQCQLCKNTGERKYKIILDNEAWEFCSSTCLLVVMTRVTEQSTTSR